MNRAIFFFILGLVLVLRPPRAAEKPASAKKPEYVRIKEMRTIPQIDGTYVVLLTDVKGRSFPIYVGQNEGVAIELHRRSLSTPRPLTHAVTRQLLEKLGARVKRVEICVLEEGTFKARLVVQRQDGTLFALDARPSDSLALTAGLELPRYVAESVVRQSMLKDEEGRPLDVETALKRLDAPSASGAVLFEKCLGDLVFGGVLHLRFGEMYDLSPETRKRYWEARRQWHNFRAGLVAEGKTPSLEEEEKNARALGKLLGKADQENWDQILDEELRHRREELKLDSQKDRAVAEAAGKENEAELVLQALMQNWRAKVELQGAYLKRAGQSLRLEHRKILARRYQLVQHQFRGGGADFALLLNLPPEEPVPGVPDPEIPEAEEDEREPNTMF